MSQRADPMEIEIPKRRATAISPLRSKKKCGWQSAQIEKKTNMAPDRKMAETEIPSAILRIFVKGAIFYSLKCEIK